MAIIHRRQKPRTYKRYKSFKKHLRVDFQFRCAYCRRHERHIGSSRSYGVDHFRPKNTNRNLICTYKNLYYCCNDCNSIKGDCWPDDAEIAQDYRFVDCCKEVGFGNHYTLNGIRDPSVAGELASLTNAGEFTIQMLQLNREDLVAERAKWLEIWTQLRRLHTLILANKGLVADDLLDGMLSSLALFRKQSLRLQPLKAHLKEKKSSALKASSSQK